MLEYKDRSLERKDNQDRDADDGADLAVLLVDARFGLTLSVASLIAHHAGLGGSEMD